MVKIVYKKEKRSRGLAPATLGIIQPMQQAAPCDMEAAESNPRTSVSNNANKVLSAPSEAGAPHTLIAYSTRKSSSGHGLLTLSSFLRSGGSRTLALFEGLVAQSLVVQLVDLGCEAESPYSGRAPR